MSAKIFLILNNKLLIVSYESVFLYFINIDYNKIIDNKAYNARWNFRMKQKKGKLSEIIFFLYFLLQQTIMYGFRILFFVFSLMLNFPTLQHGHNDG